jgi:hypothetical protein
VVPRTGSSFVYENYRDSAGTVSTPQLREWVVRQDNGSYLGRDSAWVFENNYGSDALRNGGSNGMKKLAHQFFCIDSSSVFFSLQKQIYDSHVFPWVLLPSKDSNPYTVTVGSMNSGDSLTSTVTARFVRQDSMVVSGKTLYCNVVDVSVSTIGAYCGSTVQHTSGMSLWYCKDIGMYTRLVTIDSNAADIRDVFELKSYSVIR